MDNPISKSAVFNTQVACIPEVRLVCVYLSDDNLEDNGVISHTRPGNKKGHNFVWPGCDPSMLFQLDLI